MKQAQSGFAMMLVIISLAIILIFAGFYFSRSSKNEASQYETGRQAIEDAKEINRQTKQQSAEIQKQLE
jgi:NADH:ubiquinone oxidoreductase subunit 3 (subunit A)